MSTTHKQEETIRRALFAIAVTVLAATFLVAVVGTASSWLAFADETSAASSAEISAQAQSESADEAAESAASAGSATSEAATSEAATSEAATSEAATSEAATSEAATSEAATSEASSSEEPTGEASSSDAAEDAAPAADTSSSSEEAANNGTQTNFANGRLSASSKGYSVELSYTAAAHIPAGASLAVSELVSGSNEYNTYVNLAAEEVYSETPGVLPYARFFDITILDAQGAEVQPAAAVSVKINLKDSKLNNEDVEVAAVHIADNMKSAEEVPLQVTDQGSAQVATIQADSFSIYGVVSYYTVDFYFEDAEYHMAGGSNMPLSELFSKLGITRSVAEVESVDFTNAELVSFTQDGSDWTIESLQPFSTSETLTITFTDGTTITIGVEDATTDYYVSGGDVLFRFDDATGKLTIRPKNSLGGASGSAVFKSSIENKSGWRLPDNVRSQIKEVEFQGTLTVSNGVVLNYMFADCTALEKVTGLEHFDTSDAGGLARMFSGCTSLKEIDLSSMKNTGRMQNMQNMFRDSGVETVKMPGSDFKLKDNALLANMFQDCKNLKTIDMNGFKPSNAKNMSNMFKGCTSLEELDVSSFGTLTHIVNMDGFVEGCTALTTLNIDNLDNSRIGPTSDRGHTSSEADSGITGAPDYGRALFGKDGNGKGKSIDTELPNLTTISAKNSKVWMVHNNRGVPGNEYYNAANDSEIYYFTKKQMTFAADAGGVTTQITTDRDYIDLITDRDGANVPTVDPAQNPLPDASKNINIKDGDLNTNGAGMLAPGVYTIKSEDRTTPAEPAMCDTYYRIAYLGEVPYEVTGIDDDDEELIVVEGNDNTYINTQYKDWPTTGDYVIDRSSKPIKITYKEAAVDMNGRKADVVITITKITFKDLDRIPTDPDYTGEGRREHENNNYVNGWEEDGIWYQSYFRPVLQANKSDGIRFHNYVKDGSHDSPNPEDSHNCLSKGSGTDIDFKIEIKGAPADTSFVFKGEDLDVAANQNWIADSDDACKDKLPVQNAIYGDGGEGFILGAGNDVGTLKFAEHTGLVAIGNKVITTGSDPDTSWSEFTVKADAQGASYTWTSGIACTTHALRNTKPQNAGSTKLQLQALKVLLNGTLANDQFEFKLEQTGKTPDSAPDPTNNDQTKKNDANGKVTFDVMEYGPAVDDGYFPGANPVTYTFKVKEKIPTDAQTISGYKVKDSIIYDETEHTITVVITPPANETEMIRGIKAEIYVDKTPGAGVTPDETVWHQDKDCVDCSNGSMESISEDAWYDEDGNKIDDPNPISLSSLEFKNTELETTVEVPVEKILEGRTWKDSDAFGAALELEAEDNDTPMPEDVKTSADDIRYSEVDITSEDTPVKNDDDKVIGYSDSFGAITYTASDIGKTYEYIVRELTPAEDELDAIPGITYDKDTKYTAKVAITLDDTDPDNLKLVATLTVNDEEDDQARFTNKYNANKTVYKMDAMKNYHNVNTGDGMPLEGGEFEFALKPIGDNAAIAPMPKDATGTGADRIYTTENDADDGDIDFEDVDAKDINDGLGDGLLFDYQALLDAGVSDEALHTDEGVDFEYEMWELIPGTSGGPDLKDGETLVNNNDGTWSVVGDDGYEIVYDGIHHTRKITVKVVMTEIDGVMTPVLDVEGHSDDHATDFYIDKDGQAQDVSNIPDYDAKKRHFKDSDDDLGAPIFINYYFNQSYGSIEITKVWDDADDQDGIRPDSVVVSIECDEGDLEIDDVTITGDSWSETVDSLPVYELDIATEQLKKVTYIVKEISKPAGYEVTYDPEELEFQFDEDQDFKVALTITNKHVPGQGAVEGDETWGGRGQTQTGVPKYDVNPNNPVTPTNLVKPDVEGATISDDGKTVTIPGEGSYVLNDDGTITFTPEEDFVGDPTPVDVEGTDKQGNICTATYTPHVVDNVQSVSKTRKITYVYDDGSPVLDDSGQPLVVEFSANFVRTGTVDPKTGEITGWEAWTPVSIPAEESPEIEGYTPDKATVPEVTDVIPENWPEDEVVTYTKKPVPGAITWIDGSPYKTKDQVRKVQTGTLTYKLGGSPLANAKLIDPNTGEETDALEVDVYENGVKVGTYKLDPTPIENEDGTISFNITFTPEGDYTGTPPSITLRVYDEAGNYADGIYQPEVVGDTPTPEPTPTPTPSPTPSPDKNTPAANKAGTAKTADEVPLAPLGAITLVAVAGMAFAAWRRKLAG